MINCFRSLIYLITTTPVMSMNFWECQTSLLTRPGPQTCFYRVCR